MKASQMILSALVGWIAGMVSLLVWSFLWPQIMPMAGRASALPGFWKMLLVLMLVMTPFGLVGGLIGGRLAREGGRRGQFIYAAALGALLTVVFGTCAFWYTGW
jgi:hypothetical protein